MAITSEKPGTSITNGVHCWCGNIDLIDYSTDYLRCPVCETLVCATQVTSNDLTIHPDEHGYYSRNYWFEHQEKLGLPDITTRSQTDFTDRFPFWLRALLKVRLPPAAALELGSAHGGFVYLLNNAGYNAIGLDLSPWIVNFARENFHINMLLGPVEHQDLKPSSFDLIIMMDVLEHLPDPLETMRFCASLLRPEGILMLQTPCFPENHSLESLKKTGVPFIKMLIPQEHTFLFSQNAIKNLLNRIGFEHITFEPPLFPGQDMFLLASREPLISNTPETIRAHLTSSPGGRFTLALLDLFEELENRIADHSAQMEILNADRSARLEQINTLTDMVHKLEAELASSQSEIQRQQEILKWSPVRILKDIKNRIFGNRRS